MRERSALVAALRSATEGAEPIARGRSVALNVRLLEPVDSASSAGWEKSGRLPAAVDLSEWLALLADLLVGDLLVARSQIAMVNASKEYGNVYEPTVELGWQVVA